MKEKSDFAKVDWALVLRVLAGTLGAYVVASLSTAALSLLLVSLGMARVEAVYAALMVSFTIFVIISVAVFHARNVMRSWVWLIGSAVPLGLVVWLN